MFKNKFWLVVFLAFLVVSGFAYAQDMPNYTPASQPTGSKARPTWDVTLSPQVINRLAAKDWQENESQVLEDIKELNPGLTKVKIIPQGDKLSILFVRERANKREQMTIETNPEVVSSKTGKSMRKADVTAWLQTDSQAHIREVSSGSHQGQAVWKLTAFAQKSTPLGAGGGEEDGEKNPLVDPLKEPPDPQKSLEGEGWFSRVITHSALISNFRKGGFIMYFILMCSLGGVYITIERGYELRRKNLMPPEFLEEVLTKLPDKTIAAKEHEKIVQGIISYCEEQDKPIARSLKAGLFVFNQGILGTKSAVMSSNHHEAAVLGRGLPLLEVLANIAPLLGLLGTVLGMIKAFEMISLAGTGQAEVVAAGISEALITTAGGLLVGIPLLVCYHFLEGKIEALLVDAEEFCMDVIERLVRIKEEG